MSDVRTTFQSFRDGEGIRLAGGEPLAYKTLAAAGMADYYARQVFERARRGELTRDELDTWLQAWRDPKRRERVKQELRPAAPAATAEGDAGAKARSGGARARGGARPGGAGRREKRFTLVSRGDHLRALELARAEGLSPAPLPDAERPGDVSEGARVVEAGERVAGRLITTGFWATLRRD